MSADLELATRVTEAMNAKDRDALAALFHPEVVLDGPFPLGTKNGPEKAAKALSQVAKLGVKLGAPAEMDGALTSEVHSPAGKMVLTYSFADGKVLRLDVAAPK